LFNFELRQFTDSVRCNESIMTDPQLYRKWFCRTALCCLILLMSSLVFRQSYNFAHWVPHDYLRSIGLSYSALLYFEQHADKLLHIVIAFTLTVLLICSEIEKISRPKHRALILIVTGLILVELLQFQIGRGFGVLDAGVGILASYWAFSLIK